MSTIILHTGRPKAGSSSVQRWLAGRSESLRKDHGVHLLVTRDLPEGVGRKWHLVPYESGGANSGLFVRRYLALGESAELAARFCEELHAHAERLERVVVTSEAFSMLFDHVSTPFLEDLDALGRVHEVRVAHYVRPQHESLEAWWRQWGFRSGRPPSQYLREIATDHDYWASSKEIRDVAPSVSLEMHPFRDDMLTGGDIVVDFAQHFLGVSALPVGEANRSNVGLPLAFVNLLRALPPGELWDDEHDNRRLDRLRPLVRELGLSDPPGILRSRDVLQRWCHERFETGNQELIRHQDWPTEWFVPPVPGRVSGDLSELDDLWSAETAANDEATRSALDLARRKLAER